MSDYKTLLLSSHPTGEPWKVVLTHPRDDNNWYIYNEDTDKFVKIGPVGAKRVNYYDKAIDEAIHRNVGGYKHDY